MTVSVVVADTTEAVEAANRAQREWFMREGAHGSGDEEANRLEQVWIQAKAAVADCYTDVEFEACHPRKFEELQTDFTAADGGIDPAKLDAHLPALIVACVVEDDLRDEEFWLEQLVGEETEELDEHGEPKRTGGSWAYGEKINLANRLLNLNLSAPDERIPFV